MTITQFGTVAFKNGQYHKESGKGGWQVRAIDPENVPVGQVLVSFASPITRPYSVIVTARRTAGTPLLMANYGDVSEHGFVVHLAETIADRTVQNADFSFIVLSE